MERVRVETTEHAVDRRLAALLSRIHPEYAGAESARLTEEMTKGNGVMSEQSNWEEGHFWENGMNLMIKPMLKVLATPERLTAGLKQMVAYEHANGVTAYNEPGAIYTPEMWKLYEQILGAPDAPLYAPAQHPTISSSAGSEGYYITGIKRCFDWASWRATLPFTAALNLDH